MSVVSLSLAVVTFLVRHGVSSYAAEYSLMDPVSSCPVAVATHRERRHLCSRMERKMEESTVRDVETGE